MQFSDIGAEKWETNLTKPNLLITGAAGRIATLLRPLLGKHYKLRLLDILPVPDPKADEEILQGDLADCKFALDAVKGTAAVIHLAAAVAPDLSFDASLGPNYVAVLNLLEACRQHKVARFVFASSHHVIGHRRSSHPSASEALPIPDGFYGLSKAFGEAACAMYAARYGIGTLVVRIGNGDPKVVDGRRERLWVSGRDLAQLCELGLRNASLSYEVVFGVSNCPSPLLDNSTAENLGFVPQDYAGDHHAEGFTALADLQKKDGIDFIGGFFAMTPLPNPMET